MYDRLLAMHMSTEIRTHERLYREAIPSVVSIYTNSTDTSRGPPRGAGSGFVYDRDHLVTNQHVVAGSQGIEVRFSEDDWRTGHVVGTDVYTDLAVVRIDDLPDYADPLSVTSSDPTPGQPVVALGNPMGLDGTITTGIISGTNRSMRTSTNFTIPDTVQTDAAINPGNSGGPLVTLDNEVVGVNRATGGDNIGFAISPAIVRRVIPDLIEHGTYRHSYLNIRTIDVSPVVAEANRLDETRGVLVVDVSLGPSSGALKGSRRSRSVRGREIPVGGDVIVGLDGREISSHEDLLRYLITNTQPGETIEIDLIRDDQQMTDYVTLAERPRPNATPRSGRNRGRGRGRIPFR